MKSIIIIVGILFLIGLKSEAQNENSSSSYDLSGYISVMPSLYLTNDSTLWQVLLHNRLNFNAYISKNFTISVQMRNQLIAGDFVKLMDIKNGFNKENYFLPLTWKKEFGNNYLLTSAFDRFWLQYTFSKLEIKLGRQRINWGQTFVWNPNDIFNTYNFFDFDYPERPGADAIRVQYYPSFTSSLDLAAKIDSAGNFTGGGLFRFTRWNTEFQLLTGYYSNSNKLIISDTLPQYSWDTEDLIAGLGFSSGIGTISLRGEISYLYSVQEGNDSTNQFLASVAVDYTLGSKTSMMFEFFYNDNVQKSATSFLGMYEGSQNVKTLSFTKYNIFGQLTYPVLPILNTTLAGMYFFDDNLTGFFAGPSVELSLGDNLTLSTFFQAFGFRYENPYTKEKEWLNSTYAYLRMKWNF